MIFIHRMSLEEEIDMLRVQASQDAATLHELKVALEQERESTKPCNNCYHVEMLIQSILLRWFCLKWYWNDLYFFLFLKQLILYVLFNMSFTI